MLLATALLFSITGTSCSNDDNTTPEKEKTYDMSGFAKGADVSWLTEMEKDGVKFYNQNGKATECMKLLREEGTNSIRLRVWVNPEGGWCGKNDVIAKAWRAQQLGFRLMIDFHYSDTWADPGNQKVPAAWQGYTAEQMKQAVADHTKDVLTALKDRGVTNVEWVQVGNETRDGMLFNSDEAVTGQVSKNAANFAAYINAGYDAVKEVYPKAKVIVHVDKGQDLGGLTWLYDKLKDNGGKLNEANAGVGSASHLCGMLFMSSIGTQMTTVPYQGTGPAMNDLVGGQIDLGRPRGVTRHDHANIERSLAPIGRDFAGDVGSARRVDAARCV